MAAASDRVFKLLVLPGDGIGPEIIRETLRVVDWARTAGPVSYTHLTLPTTPYV